MRLMRNARVLLPVLALTVGGCDSFLDVNQNPNAPETARVDIRLPALITQFIHSTYYGDAQLWGTEWTQQIAYTRATRSYAEVHRYELQDTDATSAWDWYYSGPLNEAVTMVRDATEPSEVYYRGLGKLFQAWTFAYITDLWGPIPFNEAFDPRIREPKYDEQKVVYEGVLKMLDEAIADLRSPTGRRPGVNDLLFNGDLTRWIKLANHVKARHELRLAYAPGENKTERAQKALTAIASAFASNADDADFTYPGGDNARNPLWTFQDQQNLFSGSQFMIDMLKARNDPRLSILFQPIIYDSVRGTGAGRRTFRAAPNTFVGHQNGEAVAADSTTSWIGRFFTNENAALNLASFADQKFTEAEARFIISGAAAADAPYRDGIRANMQKLGVAAAAINTYVAARPNLASVANPLEEIIREKYIANFLKVEPWNDWRRTGFPRLTIVDEAVIPGIPQRVRTPGSELTNNINQVTASGIPTGLEGMLTKVWWASQGPR